jgi:SAM-dependent methyltransferase
MKRSLLSILRCPDCTGSLLLTNVADSSGEIRNATLGCFACGAEFPVRDGLPVILRTDQRSVRTQHSFGLQWVFHSAGRFERDTIYGKSSAEGLESFRRAFSIGDLASLEDCLILDAGCGSGDLTAEIGKAAPQAMVVGLDFSEAARVANERCRELPNVHILQADLSRPPFAPGIFDFVWSEGVIHHTPETAQSFAKLSSLVRPGGKIYVWIYSSAVTSPYRLARRVLRKSYLLPPATLYGLAWSLAVPLYGMNKIREILRLSRFRHRLASTAYSFYDALSPEFMHYHSQSEVSGWFTRQGFEHISFFSDTSDIAVCGTKR